MLLYVEHDMTTIKTNHGQIKKNAKTTLKTNYEQFK